MRVRGRTLAFNLMDEGLLSAEAVAQAALLYLNDDDVQRMLEVNDLVPECYEEAE